MTCLDPRTLVNVLDMTTTPARARTYAELSEALARIDRTQPGRTFDLLARMLGRTDADLQHRTGISRQTINGKRTGASKVSAKDLWPLAEAVGVDVDVLLLPPSQAARWLAEHRADQLDHSGNSARQHNGEQTGTSHLSSKGSRLQRLARQHNEWSYKLGVSATAA